MDTPKAMPETVFEGHVRISASAQQGQGNIFYEWYHGPEFRSYYEMPTPVALHGRFVNVPREKVYEAIKEAVGKHLGQPLPEGTQVDSITSTHDGYIVNISNPEFGEVPPRASHEMKPRGTK
jgi:hypothetical protein